MSSKRERDERRILRDKKFSATSSPNYKPGDTVTIEATLEDSTGAGLSNVNVSIEEVKNDQYIC